MWRTTFWIALASLAACGDGTRGDAIDAATPVDAPIDAIPIDAAIPILGVDCDPVAQTGCPPGTKCGRLLESVGPDVAQTTCVPNGTVLPGGACTEGPAGPLTGYDDCEATPGHGYDCFDGTCRELCAVGTSCIGAFGCGVVPGRYIDFDPVTVGMCHPACDLVAQDCASASDACHFLARAAIGICAGVPLPARDLDQGDACYGPSPGICFLNGCAKGYGSVLTVGPGPTEQPSLCAFFCTPANTTLNQGSAATAVGVQNEPTQYDCNDDPGEGRPGPGTSGSYECRFLNSFYADTAAASPAIGLCVDTAVWGSCTAFDLEACAASPDPENDPACANSTPGCVDIATLP